MISIRAGGRGLNLPAANHVFHFDRWWNPAVEQQATDRVYRLGQRKPVFVHSLICLGTLEERIDALLDSKRELVEKVMAGRVGGLARRSRPRRDPRRRRARTRRGGGGGVRGPWARSVAGRGRAATRVRTRDVDELDVEIGRVTARVGECEVMLAAERVPPRDLGGDGCATRAACGALEEAVQGPHRSRRTCEHLLAEDWGEPLDPARRGQIRRACTCDEGGACEHVAAVGLAFADAIDDEPALLLRWRGCVDEPTPELVGRPVGRRRATRARASCGRCRSARC